MKYRFVQRILLSLCLVFAVHAVLAQQAGYQIWSEKVFIQIEKEYGHGAARRLRRLHRIMAENRNQPDTVKLEVINDALNQLPWISDRKKYKKHDYWATPLETIVTPGGDCEDIALAKYMLLRMMGIPNENMQLAQVKVKRTGKPHMVLVYIPEPAQALDRQALLILDNLDPRIRPGKDRQDLTTVYLIDHNRNVTLLHYRGERCAVFLKRKNVKASKLSQLKRKMQASNARYRSYNDGKPLFLLTKRSATISMNTR